MSLLTSQMTAKMSTAYSGLSALIQAATSQLGDLAEATESPEGSPHFRSNPTTPTSEDTRLHLNRQSLWHRNGSGAATVTPLLTPIQGQGQGTSAKPFFPEVLMRLLTNPSNEDIVTFLPDGKYFAIRRVEFTSELLYKHFQLRTFEDFLREIRGWGFIRFNGSTNEDSNCTSGDTKSGDCNESSNSSSSRNNKTDIYVFRHPHFEKNNRIDMRTIKYRPGESIKLQKREYFSLGDKTKPRIVIEHKVNSDGNNTKRQLSPSSADRNFEENRQRLRIESKSLSVDADPFVLSSSSCEQPSQLRRRSSLELRGVAQAITASKLQLNNSMEVTQDDNCYRQDSSMICDIDSTVCPRNGSDHTLPQLERRQSTASSLVDGGVETATQNIVTDAIEALLFDEGHTRETYHRHEKELSVSSLPGVVPISKQLFSSGENQQTTNSNTRTNNEASEEKKNSDDREKKEATTKIPRTCSSPSSPMVHTNIGSLEDASRNNGSNLSSSSFSSNRFLRVSIPIDSCGLQQRRGSIERTMVVSPARMEAAAALVSQSRNRND